MNMKNTVNTKKLTLTAMFSAIAVVILIIASFIPTSQLALAAVAGICISAVVIENGLVYGLMGFAASSIIGIVVTSDKMPAAFYLLFFGYYPLIKAVIEKYSKKRVIEWVLKLLVFNVALTLLWAGVAIGIVGFEVAGKYLIPLSYVGGNIVFVIYDIGFSKLIFLYITRISSRIKRK